MTNKELERTLDKISDTNLHFLVDNHLAKQDKRHKEELERTAKETEKNTHEKIHAESIVIPASPELREVFMVFAEHYKKEGRIKNSYEFLIMAFEREIFWDDEPEIEAELLKKALSKDYLKEQK